MDPMYGPRYRPGQGLAVATLVLLGCTVTFDLLGQTIGQCMDTSDGSAAVLLIGAVAMVQLLCFIATAVVFLVWLNRAFHNMAYRGSTQITISPGMAVGGWFIPVYNLVHGYSAMRILWLDTHGDADAWRPSSALVGWWWAMYLGSNVLAHVDVFTSTSAGRLSYGSVSAVTSLVYLTAAVLFGMIIWRIQRRQAAQNGDLSQLGITGADLIVPSLT